MSAAAPPSTFAFTAVILVVIILLLARRTYLAISGARYSPGQLFATAGFYVFLFALLAYSTLSAALSAWGEIAAALVIPYAIAVVGAATVATPYVRRIVRFENRAGQLYYKLPWHVPVLVLVLFVARLGIEFAIFGASAASTFGPTTNLGPGLILVLVAIDLLFGLSLGLLLGRGIGVYQAHTRLESWAPGGGAPLAPGSPPG